jgi:cobaltochelatase CobS
MTNDNTQFSNLNDEIAKLQAKKQLLEELEEKSKRLGIPVEQAQQILTESTDADVKAVPQEVQKPYQKKKWLPREEYFRQKALAEKQGSQPENTEVVATHSKGVSSKPKTYQPTVRLQQSAVVEPNVDTKMFVPPAQNIVNQADILQAMEFAVSQNMPVLLSGETGTGKTTLVKELAHKHNQPLLRLNLNGNTTTDEFLGKMLLSKEGTKYIYGLFTRAVKYGYWILIDEINAGRPEILFVLQAVLERSDNGKLTSLTLAENEGEIITPHENFRVFATMNPSDGYVGVNDLNKATRGRFPVSIEVPYPDTETEVKIIKSKLPQRPKVADAEINDAVLLAQDIRNGCKQGEYEYGISTRDLIQWLQVNEHYGNLVESAQYTVLGKCNQEDSEAIGSILKVYFSASTEVKATDGKTNEKYKKGHILQVCDDLVDVQASNRGRELGKAKAGAVFEVTQIKGGETFARLLRGEVVVPEKPTDENEYRPRYEQEAGETVELSHHTIVRLSNVEVARTRRVDTTSKR